MLHSKFQDQIISLLVLEKKIFYGFLPFFHLAWQLSWSCDLDHLYKLWFPLPKEALNLALIGYMVSEKNIFENGGQTDDGRTPEHGYTISSPSEPDGSGKLKKMCPT